MLTILKKKHIQSSDGQMIASEYVIVLFVVVAVISGMSVYFRRSVQGRIRDAHNAMFNIVKTRLLGSNYSGTNVFVQYEPYYQNTTSDVTRVVQNTDSILPSLPLTSGIFRKTLNETTRAGTISVTTPPVNAD